MIGVNVLGMPFGVHGLGQVMRSEVRGMCKAGIDVALMEINYSSLKKKLEAADMEQLLVDDPKHDINILCLNLPMIRLLARDNPEYLEGRYNIAIPFFEFHDLQKIDLEGLDVVDEIWVSNDFLNEIFSGHTNVPIIKHPLFLEPEKEVKPSKPKAADEPFTFGFSFDCNSMVTRKDPVALILAFLEAFGDQPDLPVKLKVKYKMEDAPYLDYKEIALFQELAEKDSRIELVNHFLSNGEMAELFESFDAYVSPHRTEGLGLGIFETMLRGKPVIATNYSAPKEFLKPSHSYPVESFEAEVAESFVGTIAPYYKWRQISVDDLARIMTHVFNNQDEARAKGLKGKKYIESVSSELKFGKSALSRLKKVENLSKDKKADAIKARLKSGLKSGLRSGLMKLQDYLESNKIENKS